MQVSPQLQEPGSPRAWPGTGVRLFPAKVIGRRTGQLDGWGKKAVKNSLLKGFAPDISL
jgi:hypothetical protein